MISHNANQNKCSIMKQQIVTSHAKLTFNKTKWNHQKEKHTQLDNFHNPTNRATTRYSYMRRTLHKKKTPPPLPSFQITNFGPEKSYVESPVKTRGSPNGRTWTDTGPPEPFHPFTGQLVHKHLEWLWSGPNDRYEIWSSSAGSPGSQMDWFAHLKKNVAVLGLF